MNKSHEKNKNSVGKDSSLVGLGQGWRRRRCSGRLVLDTTDGKIRIWDDGYSGSITRLLQLSRHQSRSRSTFNVMNNKEDIISRLSINQIMILVFFLFYIFQIQ